MKTLPILLTLAVLCGCTSTRVYDKTRVAILDIKSSGSLGQDGPMDRSGIRSALEAELIKRNVTVVDDAEFQAVYSRLQRGEATGIYTTATSTAQYQPCATHGIIVDVYQDINFLTVLSMGIVPYPIKATTRLLDLRTGEVRASMRSWAWANWYSLGGATRAVGKVAKQVADTLQLVQAGQRHLNKADWPTPRQTELSDPLPVVYRRHWYCLWLCSSSYDPNPRQELRRVP